ncbi:MAG: RnfABCDGE type electron transport complex subunit B, partial [Bacteroidetes bacterium]|nr:RnfABCDGE type electron transport complex subunit B [Bacteroidota bacterium]
MDTSLFIAIATMGGLGFIFAGGLALADKKLRVEENPLIGKINELLPGANCGACGKAGCYDFATNITEGKSAANGCPVGGDETAIEIAEMMGVESSSTQK